MHAEMLRGLSLSCVTCACLAVSCGGVQQKAHPVVDAIKPLFVEELKLAVTISPEANQKSPVAVDLVMAYDPKFLEQIGKLTAKDWFAQREQFRLDFAEQYQAWEWEWVPGQQVPLQKLVFNPRRVKGTLLFANYLLPGTHRAKIDPLKRVTIRLGDETFTLRNP